MFHLEGSVVHQDVDPPEFTKSTLYDYVAVRLARDVTVDEEDLFSGLLHPPGCFLGIVVFVKI
jgi:hypothetical protein